MVLCFIALPILLVMGIFSVKYRILARDALECMGKTILFKKCKSRLDEGIRSHITGKIIKKSGMLGLFFYRNFQVITTIFIILLLLSLFFGVTGFFNYLKYGNCNGPDSDGAFCVYSVLGIEGGIYNNSGLCNNEELTKTVQFERSEK